MKLWIQCLKNSDSNFPDVCSSSYPAFPPLSAIAIHNTMWLESHWRNIRQTLLLLFTAALLIGVTMLAVSSNINPVGYFFLGVGGFCLIGYLLSVFAECYVKHQQTQNANLAAPRMQSQAGVNNAYEAPTYEEVMSMPNPTIWTITSNAGTVSSPVGDPPPYSVVIESPALAEAVVETFSVSVASGTRHFSEADAGSRLRLRLVLPPRLQRFSSDIHEVKGAEDSVEPLEPLTPPPAYDSDTEDEVFEETVEPARL
ncbi:PREDICTED: transmembrane protein 139 isoform X1 [Gavialis gangeticus]|uniref:transmembrane protein 139 isoform X1 n=2 Tax=Gavialis gangeticus TaxID=94835 RepID=UPI00092E3E96|nr:PREDICTED: transmembrane protein 139 isoform X1 [Gavialis gangeticus]